MNAYLDDDGDGPVRLVTDPGDGYDLSSTDLSDEDDCPPPLRPRYRELLAARADARRFGAACRREAESTYSRNLGGRWT